MELFGTDGIRGLAGEFPLDRDTVALIARSLARHFTAKLGRPPRFVTGRDTRQSGAAIERAFHDGAAQAGATCESAGIMTTPGVAFLTRQFEFDAGVVISASHNPFQDNGIKIFSPSGRKLDAAYERLIEADVQNEKAEDTVTVTGESDVNTDRAAEFADEYLMHLVELGRGPARFDLKIVADCANGAASGLAARMFRSAGADVVPIHSAPNGRNINENCGSLHLEDLAARVTKDGAHLGVAFDGDADRALFVDQTGSIVDGDATMWIMARYLKEHGKLANSTVVATVMSNLGLEMALKSQDIKLLRTPVGDKYVLDELLATGAEIGGEQSGHMIFPEISLVGDGLMTSLLVLRALKESGKTMSELVAGFERFPQTLVNVKVREKRAFESVPEIAAAAAEIEHEMGDSGRLLLRYSGTENLARVMIEGRDQAAVEAHARRLADTIAGVLG